MLFNFTTHTSFPCNNPSEAIYCSKNYGPYFGSLELSAWDEPFNKENACSSWTNDSGYNIPQNSEEINMLTNQMSYNRFGGRVCKFTISEIEVWGVNFK
jgi:hypothetical protein